MFVKPSDCTTKGKIIINSNNKKLVGIHMDLNYSGSITISRGLEEKPGQSKDWSPISQLSGQEYGFFSVCW